MLKVILCLLSAQAGYHASNDGTTPTISNGDAVPSLSYTPDSAARSPDLKGQCHLSQQRNLRLD